jgi:hypothetical protein
VCMLQVRRQGHRTQKEAGMLVGATPPVAGMGPFRRRPGVAATELDSESVEAKDLQGRKVSSVRVSSESLLVSVWQAGCGSRRCRARLRRQVQLVIT